MMIISNPISYRLFCRCSAATTKVHDPERLAEHERERECVEEWSCIRFGLMSLYCLGSRYASESACLLILVVVIMRLNTPLVRGFWGAFWGEDAVVVEMSIDGNLNA